MLPADPACPPVRKCPPNRGRSCSTTKAGVTHSSLLLITCCPWHLQIRAALMRMSATLAEGGDPVRGGPASTQDLFRLLHASMVAQRLAEKSAQNLDMGAIAQPGATEGEHDRK